MNYISTLPASSLLGSANILELAFRAGGGKRGLFLLVSDACEHHPGMFLHPSSSSFFLWQKESLMYNLSVT